MIILDGSFLINDSVVFVILKVAETFRVAANIALNFIPVFVHCLIIDVEVIHVTRFNGIFGLEHGIVRILLLALVYDDLALAELGA
jgi:hypothetical protein